MNALFGWGWALVWCVACGPDAADHECAQAAFPMQGAAAPVAGGWPHAPMDWTIAADNPMSHPIPEIVEGAWVDGWGVAWNDSNLATVPDTTAPHSPPEVLQMRFPIGFVGGQGPGMPFYPIGEAAGVYVGLWWKPSDPWHGHVTGSNKLQYLFTRSAGSMTMVMYEPDLAGRYELRVYLQFEGLPGRWLHPDVATVAVSLGQWHQVEWLVEFTSARTGRVRWWLDGALLGDCEGLPFPGQPFAEYQLSAVWGGLGDVKRSTDYYWLDHAHLRTTRTTP